MSLYEGLKENPEFVSFLESCDQNPRCRNLPLFSFLIKPVQRICKYPLLLKVCTEILPSLLFSERIGNGLQDLIRDTDESMDDWRTLTAAKHKIDGIAEKVNENQKAAEGAQARDMQKLMDIASCIDTEVRSYSCHGIMRPSSLPNMLRGGFNEFFIGRRTKYCRATQKIFDGRRYRIGD